MINLSIFQASLKKELVMLGTMRSIRTISMGFFTGCDTTLVIVREPTLRSLTKLNWIQQILLSFVVVVCAVISLEISFSFPILHFESHYVGSVG